MEAIAIADLYYISEYAQALRDQMKAGMKPNQVLLNRMATLAEKVQRQYDPSYEEWCDAESRH
jgi:hypothetical protein